MATLVPEICATVSGSVSVQPLHLGQHPATHNDRTHQFEPVGANAIKIPAAHARRGVQGAGSGRAPEAMHIGDARANLYSLMQTCLVNDIDRCLFLKASLVARPKGRTVEDFRPCCPSGPRSPEFDHRSGRGASAWSIERLRSSGSCDLGCRGPISSSWVAASPRGGMSTVGERLSVVDLPLSICGL